MTKDTTRRKPASKGARKTRRRKPSRHLWRKVFITLGASLLVALVASLAYLRTSNPGAMGIDVSHYQAQIDWETLAGSQQVQFVYVKATQGTKLDDDCYLPNVSQARKHGLKVGAYHFFRNGEDGVKQFQHFSRVVGRDFDLIPMLDLEADGGKIADIGEYRRQIESFVQCCEREYGTPPILYSNISFWKDYVQPAASWCPYWAAWYPLQKSSSGLFGWIQAQASRLFSWLTGWTGRQKVMQLAHPTLRPVVWQYTDQGTLPGITGPVDLDECWDMEAIRWQHADR